MAPPLDSALRGLSPPPSPTAFGPPTSSKQSTTGGGGANNISAVAPRRSNRNRASDCDEEPMRLWHIHGKSYDLTPFLEKHPGGSLILKQTRGLEDATPLFESYHALGDSRRIAAMMKQYEVASPPTTAPPEVYTFESDGLYARLKAKVRAHFGDKALRRKKYKAGPVLVVVALLTTAAWFTAYYAAFLSTAELSFTARAACAVFSGAMFICLGFQLMHDASHYALTPYPAVDNAVMDLWCGAALWSGSLWHAHHVVHHHSFTGCKHRDPDIFHCRPLLRKHADHNPRKTMFTGRLPSWLVPPAALSVFFVFPGMWLGQTMAYETWRRKGRIWSMPLPKDRTYNGPTDPQPGLSNTGRHSWSMWSGMQQLVSLVSSGLGLAFLLTQLYAWRPSLTLLYVVAMNAAYAAMIFPDHDTLSTHENEVPTPPPPYIKEREAAKERAQRDHTRKLQRSSSTGGTGETVPESSSEDEDETSSIDSEDTPRRDWGEVQVRHSGNFGGWFSCQLFGGINYQIEHHLFPSISHSHLPAVAQIVREECEKSGVPYVHHTSLYAAVQDFFRKMTKLNKTEEKKKLQ